MGNLWSILILVLAVAGIVFFYRWFSTGRG